MKPYERIFVALDTPDLERARFLVEVLASRVGGFKIGLEAFAAHGPAFVREVVGRGRPVFLDLKLHDIPNTVAGAARAAARLGASFLTVHALGGAAMIACAVEAAAEGAGLAAPRILAVTILTSHADGDLARVGIAGPAASMVPRLAALAREAGAHGAVCSPFEAASVRSVFPSGLLFVPGIRSASVAGDDQKRTTGARDAVARGADRLVVGRPITGAPDPAAAADALAREIAGDEP